MRTTLPAINAELQRRGYNARLAKAAGYFYFWSGEAVDWLDRTVRVSRVGDLTLDQWVAKFLELRKLNWEIARVGKKTPVSSPRVRHMR